MMKKILIAGALLALCAPASAEVKTIKVGVLTDMAGIFSDFSGAGSVAAARLAAEDFNKSNPDVKIEILSADHQTKADLASSIARKWFDEDGVDVVVDLAGSSIALAVSSVAREKNKVALVTNSATADLTGAKCNANTVQWTIDAVAQSKLAKTFKRGSTWFFITADYAYGYSIEQMASALIKADDGKVLGAVRHPTNMSDLSSLLLQAQASNANVIGLANSGSDLIATVKQAKEFGVSGGKQTFAAFATYISDIHSLGLSDAKGLMFISVFYWDLNPKTRDFAKRFEVLRPGRMPSQGHAATYSSLSSYFTAAKKAGSTKDGANIVKTMRERGEFDDPLFGRTTVRIDGRAMYQTYLVKVKTPQESKGPWDYYNIVNTLPADEAFRTLQESKAAGCALVP